MGLTDYATGGLSAFSPLLTNRHVRPFTGSFPVIGQFGSGLPITGISHFRIEYRRIGTAGLVELIAPSSITVGWKPLDSGNLSRTYVVQEGLDFRYYSYPMGPYALGGGAAYRIPPFDPQDNGVDGLPASTDPTARWTQYDRVVFGRINTDGLDGDGLYEFRLQFLDGSGNPATVNDAFFRVPDPTDAGTTMASPASYLRSIAGNSVFQFRLRIDTAETGISIEGVSLTGNPNAMTPCGFVEFQQPSDSVGITFTAEHPQDFAVFSFNLERGRQLAITNPFTTGDAAGMVSGSEPPYTLGPDGKYRGSFSVASLLGSSCGNKAAFSESLTIQGLHTDGYHAGTFFRRTLHNAFAVAEA